MKKKKDITSPKLDLLIQNAQGNPSVDDSRCIEMLLKITREPDKLEAQGDDELRSI